MEAPTPDLREGLDLFLEKLDAITAVVNRTKRSNLAKLAARPCTKNGLPENKAGKDKTP